MKIEVITCMCGCQVLPVDQEDAEKGWLMDRCSLHGAASSLLAACEQLVSSFDDCDSPRRWGDSQSVRVNPVDSARAAIAKAKGDDHD